MGKVLVYLLLLWMPFTGVARRLKRIEGRIARIEAKYDIDSVTRREDMSDLSQRIDDMENWLNVSLTGLSVSGLSNGLEGDENLGMAPTVDMSLADDILRVKSAFAKEKARLRRHISDTEHSIQAVQDGLSSEMQSLGKTIKNELVLEVNKIMKEVKDELTSDVKSLIKDVKRDVEDIIDTLDTLQSIKQDTSTKGSASPVTLKEPVDHASVYSSCRELYKSGEHMSGAYDIVLAGYSAPIRVYCDMTTDGGGWTVFQRRQDGSEDFFRGWDDYASGFGNVEGEFWLGNDYISHMTGQCCHELRIDMEDFEGNSAFAKDGRFKVFSRVDDYKLDVGEFSGNASDSLNYHLGMRFTTKDKDNDQSSSNCASSITGAWWHKECYYSNLNGVYYGGGSNTKGITWWHWKRRYEDLKRTEMKLRKL